MNGDLTVIVVSDWGGSNDHALGVKNGSHLEMPGTGNSGVHDIVKAVKNGDLTEEVLDQRLDELLSVIFDTHQATEEKKGTSFDIEAHHKLARKAAQESIVLLKNEDRYFTSAAGNKGSRDRRFCSDAEISGRRFFSGKSCETAGSCSE